MLYKTTKNLRIESHFITVDDCNYTMIYKKIYLGFEYIKYKAIFWSRDMNFGVVKRQLMFLSPIFLLVIY